MNGCEVGGVSWWDDFRFALYSRWRWLGRVNALGRVRIWFRTPASSALIAIDAKAYGPAGAPPWVPPTEPEGK